MGKALVNTLASELQTVIKLALDGRSSGAHLPVGGGLRQEQRIEAAVDPSQPRG